jgi:RNA polymerase sigma factor (sigma-70 family)
MQFENIYLCLLNGDNPSIQEFDRFLKTLRVRIRAEFRHRCKRSDLEKNEAIVNDVLSETLERISYNIHKYSPEKSTFLTWIYGIIKNVCLNYATKTYGFHKIGVDHAILLPDEEKDNGDIFEYLLSSAEIQQSAESKVLEEEMLQHIIKVLDRLSQQQYNVMYLHFREDLSIEEISIRLNISKENVSRTLYKARQKIRKCLREMGYRV